MTVVAVTMVKDERDIIGWTLAHLLNEGVDRIVVADNLSTDGTYEWLLECARAHDAITVVRDHDPAYYQADKMTALANTVADVGDWVIPFDADELWFAIDGMLAEHLHDMDADAIFATPFVHVPTRDDDRDDLNPFTRITHRMDTPEPHPKVCVRWSHRTKLHMGNHGADGLLAPILGSIGVRHFQYRSLAQVQRKAVNGANAYAATNLPETFGSHWRNLAAMQPWELHRWWAAYVHQPGLVNDPAPFALCPR